MSVFAPEQQTTSEGFNIVAIRRNDMVLKRYDGNEPREVFMSSDEYLYEVAYEKGRIIKNLSLLLKQSAIDCEIHRKLHAKERPVIQCMRFDTTASGEDLAFKPSYKTDDRDTLYMRNITRRTRRLQMIKAKDILLIVDPDTNEVLKYVSKDGSVNDDIRNGLDELHLADEIIGHNIIGYDIPVSGVRLNQTLSV